MLRISHAFAVFLAAGVILLGVAAAGGAWSAAREAAGALQDKHAPAKGMFLVASRGMSDPRFHQTVILLLHHGPRGTMGVVVNRPSEISIAHLRPELEGVDEQGHEVYYGGPVAPNTLIFLLRSDATPAKAGHVFSDIYAGGSQAALTELIEQSAPVERLRIYFGHAGWAPGQLDVELARGQWHLTRGESEGVFRADSTTLWDELIEEFEHRDILVRLNRPRSASSVLETRSLRGV